MVSTRLAQGSSQDGDGNFAEVGRGGGGAHTRTARAVVTRAPQSQLAAHAELAANSVVECASGRAPRFTAAAWDKGETIAW